jgi:hypothetical protein
MTGNPGGIISAPKSACRKLRTVEVCGSTHPVPALAPYSQRPSEIADRSGSRWTHLFQKPQMECSHSALRQGERVSIRSLKILIAALSSAMAYWVNSIFGNSTGGGQDQWLRKLARQATPSRTRDPSRSDWRQNG